LSRLFQAIAWREAEEQPVIPGRSNRKKRIRHDKQAYKDRNVIERCERCYCRLKDFRRIATRYDKLARNYFSALCFVAGILALVVRGFRFWDNMASVSAPG
jgi:transposase